MKNRRPYFDVAQQFFNEQHPDAVCAYIAGSNLCGQANPYSDIDIVILYNKNFEDVRRESLVYCDWPIEVFIHNEQSCDYFMHEDYKRGKAPFIHMIKEGRILPEPFPDIAIEKKEKAKQYFENGPMPWSNDQINRYRYMVCDLMDDLKGADADPFRQHSILIRLYHDLGELYLGGQRQWHGNGKALLRLLKRHNEKFACDFSRAFNNAFKNEDIRDVLCICDQVLDLFGGRNWEHYQAPAPEQWKFFNKGPELGA